MYHYTEKRTSTLQIRSTFKQEKCEIIDEES